MSTYEIHEGYEYYDENEGDARGYPVKKWHSSGGSFDSHHRPEVGDSWIFEENGKLYRRSVRSVISRGSVWEDTEALDVEYDTIEISPGECVIDSKWVDGKNRYGVINGRLEVVVPFEYDEIVFLSQSPKYVAMVRKDNKWGVFDCEEGALKIPVSYDSISIYGSYYKAKIGDANYLFDDKYEKRPDAFKSFKIVSKIYDSYFFVKVRDREGFGVLDEDGNLILPVKYDNIYCVENGFLTLTKDNGESVFSLFDKRGQLKKGPFHRLTEIPDDATELVGVMYDFSALDTLDIPDHITKVEINIGSNCEHLETVFVGENVSDLSMMPFFDCHSLKYIIVSEENPYYSSLDGVLFDKEKTVLLKVPPKWSSASGTLQEYVIPKSVRIINAAAFMGTSVEKVVIPAGVTEIGPMAFMWNKIKELMIPDSVTSIGHHAFAYCSLKSVQLPNSLKCINNSTFYCCGGINNITVPDSVKDIGNYAFYNCSGLESLVLPKSMNAIGYCAFMGCSHLQYVSFPESLRKIEFNAFDECRSLKKIRMPQMLFFDRYFYFKCDGSYGNPKLKIIQTTRENYEKYKRIFPEGVDVEFIEV